MACLPNDMNLTYMDRNEVNNNMGSIYGWSAQDCYAWATEQLSQMGVYAEEDARNFKDFCGAQVAMFTVQDFTARISTKYGHIFYQIFQDLLRSEGIDMTASTQEYQLKTEATYDDPYLNTSWVTDCVARVGTPDEIPVQVFDELSLENGETYLNLEPLESTEAATGTNDWYSFLNTSSFPPSTPLPPSPAPSSSSSSPSSSSYQLDLPYSATPPLEDDFGYFIPEEVKPLTLSTPTPAYEPQPAPAPRRTRPQRRHAHTPPMECGAAGGDPLDPLTTPSRKRSRGPKSWEFVVRMLADERYNPSLISWVNGQDFTFKFNRPGEIARMWGNRANKPNLSYDNFARGLRYHYKTGALQPVSERQLVYKCGNQAIKFFNDITRN